MMKLEDPHQGIGSKPSSALSIDISMKSSKYLQSTKMIVACMMLTHLGIGYGMNCLSSSMNLITEYFNLSSGQRSMLASAALFGNIFGSPIGGMVADKAGRKKALVMTWIIALLSFIGQASASNYAMLLIPRLFTGFACGAHYAAITSYMSETLDDKIVDSSISMVELTFYVGSFIAVGMGLLLSKIMTDALNISWRIIIISGAVPLVLGMFLMMAYLAESPMFLALREQPTGETSDPLEGASNPGNQPTWAHLTLSSSEIVKNTAFVAVFWSFIATPAYAISTFAISIIDSLALPIDSNIVNTLMGTAGVIGVLVGLGLVTCFAIRTSLLVGYISTTIPLIVLTLMNRYVVESNTLTQITGVLMLVFYNVAINVAAPLCMIYPARLFPIHLKSTASGIAAVICRLVAVSCMFGMGYGVDSLPIYAVFGAVSGILFLVTTVLYFITPKDTELNKYAEIPSALPAAV